MAFVTGDIVELKSGGPKMTVKGNPGTDPDLYDCQWFGGKKLENGFFRGDSIKLSSTDKDAA